MMWFYFDFFFSSSSKVILWFQNTKKAQYRYYDELVERKRYVAQEKNTQEKYICMDKKLDRYLWACASISVTDAENYYYCYYDLDYYFSIRLPKGLLCFVWYRDNYSF